MALCHVKSQDEDEEEDEEEEGSCDNGNQMPEGTATSSLPAARPLKLTDPNAAAARVSNGGAATSSAQRTTPAKKMKKLYKPSYEGKRPDAEDAGFALFHDKHGRDCQD